MPLLAAMLAGLFGSIADIFVKWMGKKAAFGAAAVSVFGLLTVALYGALSLGLNALVPTLPDWPGFAIGAWVAVPPAVPGAIAALISGEAAIALYRWNVENLKILSYIT